MQIFAAIFVGVDWMQDKAKTKGAFPVYRKRKKIRVRGVRVERFPHIYFTLNFQFRFSELLKQVLFVCIRLNINALFYSWHGI